MSRLANGKAGHNGLRERTIGEPAACEAAP